MVKKKKHEHSVTSVSIGPTRHNLGIPPNKYFQDLPTVTPLVRISKDDCEIMRKL